MDWTRIWLVVICLMLLFGIGTCAIGGCTPDYSDGYRAGVVSKLSKKGVLMKSWEGDLIVGGMEQAAKGGGLVPMVFHFSVTDDAVAKKIAEIQTSGKRVRLHYVEWLMHPAKIDTGYVVDEVVEE